MFKFKKAELSITQLISLILVIVVVVVVIMSILNPHIWDWARNLPDYTYNDTDKVIEYVELTKTEVDGICPGASRVGTIGRLTGAVGFREQYINFLIGNELWETELYWRGTETDAEIWLLKEDKYTGWDWFERDLLVANVEKGIIKVEPSLLDLDSEIYQRTRFEKEVLELTILPLLEDAYLAFNNQICRVGEPAKLKPAWPENIGKELNLIRPKISREGKKYKIDLSPYLIPQAINFLYLVDGGSFIEIKGDIIGFNYKELGRIYPDGSVWIDNERMNIKRGDSKLVKINFGEEFFGQSNLRYHPFYETNLRVETYDLIKELQNEK
jgi:hypothetical protein